MYCAPIWVSRITSKNAIQQLNAVFSNFIKRYLGLPKYVSNSAVHYYCGTWPLFYALRHLSTIAISKINFPSESMHEHKLSFTDLVPLPPYVPETDMDLNFPREKIHIPRKRSFRIKIFRELFIVDHYKTCVVERFHSKLTCDCKCLFCGQNFARGHTCIPV